MLRVPNKENGKLKGHFICPFLIFFFAKNVEYDIIKRKHPKCRKQIEGSDRIMAENKSLAADDRRRRIQRIKKGIILMLMLVITVPVVLCIFLLVRVYSLYKALNALVFQF